MEQPFEFCALRYLLLWEQKERHLHALMSATPSVDALRKALHHYRVSRGFRGIAEEANAKQVLGALRVCIAGAHSRPEQAVERLASRFAKDFKQSNLSAASKLLWLTHRRPYLIYDGRAVSALKRLGQRFDKRSYSEYASAWHTQYKASHAEVAHAVEQLPALQPFFATWHKSAESIRRLATAALFRERVFDIYLWELGGDGSQETPSK